MAEVGWLVQTTTTTHKSNTKSNLCGSLLTLLLNLLLQILPLFAFKYQLTHFKEYYKLLSRLMMIFTKLPGTKNDI